MVRPNLRHMRTQPPPIIPLFRSDGQARLLSVLFDRSQAPLTIRELADRTQVPHQTVHREVARLADHGMVTITTVGRTRLVSADWALPWAGALADLVAMTVGLPAALGRALAPLTGLEEALIFGSWAARFVGEDGPPPGDIDVLVIGSVDLDEARNAVAPTEQIAGVYINVTSIPRSQWNDVNDPFVATVLERPTVPIPTMAQVPVHR